MGGVVVVFGVSFGLVAVAGGVVLTGVVVEAGGVLLVAAGLFSGVAPVGAVPPELDPAEFTPDVGVVVGALAGKVVIGVGSGGNGFDKMLAIISLRPVSVWL